MPISGDSYAFSQSNVNKASKGKGVYSLHKGGETIYIGKAESETGIRGRLQAHLRGSYGPCTQQTIIYRYERRRNPSIREQELLLEYKLAHGQLPLCNK